MKQPAHVTLEIYDVLGRTVATLVSGNLPPGEHTVTWDAHSQPSGVYVYRLQTGRRVETKQMVLMR